MGKIYMGKNNSTGSKLKLISTIIRVKKNSGQICNFNGRI